MSSSQFPPEPSDPPSPSPSEVPGTPTSTTTSLSALSTTAIKDGHRGHPNNPAPLSHTRFNTHSQEAEQRADRISRLPGLSSYLVSSGSGYAGSAASARFPTSRPGTGHVPQPVAAYFDAAGQPVVTSKMSTVGSASASATESMGGTDGGTVNTGTNTASGTGTEVGDAGEMEGVEEDRGSFLEDEDEDEEMGGVDEGENESLVGFGEGAGSVIEGDIYGKFRPGLGGRTGSGALARENSGSGLSEEPSRKETPVSLDAVKERRDARMMNGVALDGTRTNGWVDTTTRGPTQQPGSHQHVVQHQRPSGVASPTTVQSRETAERILSERLGGSGQGQGMATGNQAGALGKFFFEER
ncbi:hypothetical protein QBC42DRAFT_188458 [Cladorrhinum samala]|uniref:Uncharacterized protein n=1 Tax=Cladorrhinum samala TaxID=585594 RepID=A0AAV9HA26_9PEZI|nr:hypothetical protein QBC42DRAFT_188458 [Cladorrhinum samala]